MAGTPALPHALNDHDSADDEGHRAPIPFELEADHVGYGRLLLNGADVTDEVMAVEVIVNPGQATRLLVHVHAEGKVTGLASIETVRDIVSGDHVRRLDPKKIEKEALGRLSMATASLAQIRLQVIAEMLDEAQGAAEDDT